MTKLGAVRTEFADRPTFAQATKTTPKPPAVPKTNIEELFDTMRGLIKWAGNLGPGNFIPYMLSIVTNGWCTINSDFCEKLAEFLQIPERYVKEDNVKKLFGADPKSGLVQISALVRRLKQLAPQIKMKMATIGQDLVGLFRASAIYFAKSAREAHPDFRLSDYAGKNISLFDYRKALGFGYSHYVQENPKAKDVGKAISIANRLKKMTDAQIRGLKVNNPEIRDAIMVFYMARMDMTMIGKLNYDIDPEIDFSKKEVNSAYLKLVAFYAQKGFVPFEELGKFNEDNLVAWAKLHPEIDLSTNRDKTQKEQEQGPTNAEPT